MSTIFYDCVKLESPIMFDPKSKEQFWPEDSQYQRLLREKGIDESELQKCFHAIRVTDASGATMLDPFYTEQQMYDWIRDHIDMKGVYIDGNLRKFKNELEKRIGKKIPDSKIYGWKERRQIESQVEAK